jgi:hypothetical protein
MSKIHVLGETRGPKHEVERVVHDHLYAKLAEIERNVSELESTGAQFTARYRMKWEDFKTRFEKGNGVETPAHHKSRTKEAYD